MQNTHYLPGTVIMKLFSNYTSTTTEHNDVKLHMDKLNKHRNGILSY